MGVPSLSPFPCSRFSGFHGLDPTQSFEHSQVEFVAIVAEPMIGGFDHPHPFGLIRTAEHCLSLLQRQKLVMGRVNLGQRNWAYPLNDVFHHEAALVWGSLRNPDRKVLPLPSELVLVRKSTSQDATDARLDAGFGGCEDRQARTF